MILPGFSKEPVRAAVLPPPPPKRDDPAIAESRKKLRASELRRKGRRSTIVTGGEGVLGEAPLIQPQARGAQLFGG